MQVQAPLRAALIAAGSVTLTFRRWRRRQVVAGHRYRTAAGRLEVEAVDVVDVATVTDAEAAGRRRPVGGGARADLRGSPDLPLYRVRFHLAEGPDPRDELARSTVLSDEDRADLDRRLDRLDRAAAHGPWTDATLAVIASHPGVVGTRSGHLAGPPPRRVQARRAQAQEPGSHHQPRVGYRLSPRGEAYRAGPGRP